MAGEYGEGGSGPETEAYLRLAVDAGRMAVWDFDVAAARLAGSPELYRILGFPADSAPGIDEIRSRYYPGERERLAEIGRLAITRGERYAESEFRYVLPDGSVHWLMLRAEIHRDGGGVPVRFLGVLLDVTRQKLIEADLRRSESLKTGMLDASLDCIITVDGESRVVEWNSAAETVFGFARSAVLGRDLGELIIPPEWRQKHDAGMRHYLATGEGPLLGRRVELEALRADGSRFPVELAISPVEIEGRSFFTAFIRDITERRAEEAQRELLTHELAHRVKNMLAMVQAIVGQTLRQTRDVETGRRAVDARLAALAKAHDRLISSNWCKSPIRDVVDDALAMHRTNTGRFRVEGAPLMLDAGQALALSLGLHELATNAVKYGALSTDEGYVDLSWKADADGLRFEWKERGGPRVELPTRTGFGSRLLEGSLAGYFQGTASIVYEPDGLRFVLDASPAEQPG